MSPPDDLVDTSAAVALVVEAQEAHDRTRAALEGRRLGLAGHAGTYPGAGIWGAAGRNAAEVVSRWLDGAT